MKYSAAAIAEATGQFTPTPQQRAVIEAPLAPAIVIAGAGSGKTETMANRVVWLIANGEVGVSDVLGLTFTRKAAGELSQRIRTRIGQLAKAGLVPDGYDPFDAPTVATYNSFANSIFRDNALLIGRESDSGILSEASAWQLARRLVTKSADDRLVTLDKPVDSLTSAVIALSRAMSENIVEPSDVTAMAARFVALADLPTGSNRASSLNATLRDSIQAVGALPVLVDLASQFAREKLVRGFVEYSDQVAFALAVAERVPRVVTEFRDRYRVVLLDEYQDTSVVQTRLLSTLFSGMPVMAVGDPHQSIYGWRGASAANLGTFAHDFTGSRTGALEFPLSTSWRNPMRVLDAANTLVAPLQSTSLVAVHRLEPRPDAGAGTLDAVFGETVEEEAREVAQWFRRQFEASGDEKPSAAMLCRSVKKIDAFTTAFDAAGVKYHVLGLGGLLEQPVVADLVCALRVIYYATAESELVRLLSGARWRVGTRDIHALSRVASWLAERDHRHSLLTAEVKGRLRSSVVSDEGRSLVDALDFVAEARDGHRMLADFTPAGLSRLRAAGRQLAFLRTRTGLDLPDLVNLVTQELLLDVEVAANSSNGLARASLDAFAEQITAFVTTDPSATLGAFLSWLEEAEKRDKLAPRTEEPEAGTVQILTIHGSKGLEWDVVAIPRMVEGELPGAPQSKQGWLAFGELPYEFRGDALHLPVLPWRGCETQVEYTEAKNAFSDEIAVRYAEEQRRLIYVAVTRAKKSLLLSGSFWSTQSKPRGPGAFLRELAAARLIPIEAVPDLAEDGENPLADTAVFTSWPLDPLGRRAASVSAAAAMVGTADPERATAFTPSIDLLLAERDLLLAGEVLEIPTRVAASRFKEYVTDADAVLRRLQRPVPERPYRQTRLGTRFHSWVENRFAVAGGGDLLDATEFELDLDQADRAEEAALEQLQQTFERSEWAGLEPEEVEVEVHLVLGPNIVICKIDAVFRRGDRYQIVDWKTGRAPTDAADLEVKQLQLALYRLAYAQWKGIDPGLIDAVFYFVAVDEVIRPERVYDEADLRSLWAGVAARTSDAH